MNRMQTLMLIAALSAINWTGCSQDSGPALGQVDGVVTLDGKPLPDAMVSFYPAEGGRSAHGTTDGTGKYQLRFTAFKEGAMVGQHTVKIEVGVQTGEVALTPAQKARKLPEIYNKNSELSAEVNRGSNTLDFALKSK
ncbi:carboxypeptidase-like regulatory domain-containing protein [Bremerella alba]|uniref:Carboxypeptidase regulatory-like domain-containing protein n=1 Tax=Bremerella alba TaxID=980252 RepID=A0A7V9A7M5_9BACT|nr:carboxypeptidase-like regulatory domain-containing protein [Bremerella alba]MBA2115176.1 hypothetical protein [Bremerella alba]